MASTFGASALTDAFNVAFRIPNLFRRLFAEGAFSQAFVPVLAGAGDSRARRPRIAWWTSGHRAGLVLLAVSLRVRGRCPCWCGLMASGLQQNPRAFEAAVVMTRWMFPYIAFMSLRGAGGRHAEHLEAFRRAGGHAGAAQPGHDPRGVAGAPWFATLGIEPIYALAGGVMVGGVLQLAVQLPALRVWACCRRIGLRLGRMRAPGPTRVRARHSSSWLPACWA
jgi:putative peptidoglycan lipid II flippase